MKTCLTARQSGLWLGMPPKMMMPQALGHPEPTAPSAFRSDPEPPQQVARTKIRLRSLDTRTLSWKFSYGSSPNDGPSAPIPPTQLT